MEQKDTSNIIGLLDSGPFWGNFKETLICYILIVALLLFGMGVGIYMFTMEQIANPDPIMQFVFLLVFWIVVVLSLPVVLLVLIIKNEKKRRQVQLWMEDAVLLQAESKEIGRKYQLFFFPCVKLRIDFDIDGKHYRRFSESPSPQGEEGGYYSIWAKYGNRKVDILYSKKYDRVMILKNK